MIVILFTGGTIAMRNDPGGGGALPGLTPTEILAATRGIREITAVDRLGELVGSRVAKAAAPVRANVDESRLSGRQPADVCDRLIGMTGRGPLAAISLGASISLDELAIGFSAGLLRLPVAPMVIAIAVQAFVVTQVGVRLGDRIGRRWHERAEQLAGLTLVALGAILLILNLTG